MIGVNHLDEFGHPVAAQPHPEATFDPEWRSRHSPRPMDGWRFYYRCSAGCEDAWGSIAAVHGPDDIPNACPDCRGPVERWIPA